MNSWMTALRRRLMRLVPHDFVSDARGGCARCSWRLARHSDRRHP